MLKGMCKETKQHAARQEAAICFFHEEEDRGKTSRLRLMRGMQRVRALQPGPKITPLVNNHVSWRAFDQLQWRMYASPRMCRSFNESSTPQMHR